MIYNGKYCFAYQFIPGKTLYELDNADVYSEFFIWFFGNLSPMMQCDNFESDCHAFYRHKTIERLNNFLVQRRGLYEYYHGEHTINNVRCKRIVEYLEQVDWQWLQNGYPGKMHGDLQFDNIIKPDNTNGFMYLDWREKFGSQRLMGDMYYDLAKLYGGMLINYNQLKSTLSYEIKQNDNNIILNHSTSGNWFNCQYEFLDTVLKNKFDVNKVKLLTALIFLNMSPLHESVLGDLLFFKSKLMLNDLLYK